MFKSETQWYMKLRNHPAPGLRLEVSFPCLLRRAHHCSLGRVEGRMLELLVLEVLSPLLHLGRFPRQHILVGCIPECRLRSCESSLNTPVPRPNLRGSDSESLGWGPGMHNLFKASQVILMCSHLEDHWFKLE